MWWALGTQALATGAGIWNGIKAAEERKKALEEEQRANESIYTKSYGRGRDALVGSARRALEMGEEDLLSAEKRAAARARLSGGSQESELAQLKQINDARAKMLGSVIANQAERQDSARENYMTRRMHIGSQERQMEAQRTADIAKAVSEVAKTAGNTIDAYGRIKNSK